MSYVNLEDGKNVPDACKRICNQWHAWVIQAAVEATFAIEMRKLKDFIWQQLQKILSDSEGCR